MRLPQRTTLVDQIVDILRQRLRAGEWKDMLASEHELCAQLQVSRPTLRKALAVLAKEGLIGAEHGLGWRVLARPKRSKDASERKRIGILCFVPLNEASHFTLFQIDELQRHLHQAGHEVEIYAGRQYASQNYRMALKRLVSQSNVSHWLLSGPTPPVQEWFARHNVPAFASMIAPDQKWLPSLAVASMALYRHALGMLACRGHRQFAWVIPRIRGTKQNRFWRAFESYRRREGFAAREFRHEGTVDDLYRVMGSAMKSQSRPSVLLVDRPHHVLAVFNYLIAAGFEFPTISLSSASVTIRSSTTCAPRSPTIRRNVAPTCGNCFDCCFRGSSREGHRQHNR